MHSVLSNYIKSIEAEQWTPNAERLEKLTTLIRWIEERVQRSEEIHLVYICTHNSRRSHFGQVWGKTAAHQYGISSIHTWSGGTEATALHPNAMAALTRAGFQLKSTGPSVPNPVFQVCYDDQQPPIECFSKVFSHPSNPTHDFAAVMTCTDAEKNCPLIPGAALRVGLSYEDPRFFDGTAQQDQAYDQCCRIIAREALWMFSQIKQRT